MKSALAVVLAAGALVACGSSGGIDAYGDREHSPAALVPELVGDATAARSALDQGDAASARKLLEELCLRSPHDLGLATMLQDAELAGGEEPAAVRARYLSLARERDDLESWVLAARLERAPAEAKAMLERAVRIDPRNAWARYGLAFVEARDGRWGEAQQVLKQALELDPAHLPARRLEAALLARDGKLDDARHAYLTWLEAARGDPRIDPELRVAAQLDLALVEIEGGHEKEARARLAALPETLDGTGAAGRRLCLLAAAEHSLGNSELALEAAKRAEVVDPSRALPMVQQALLNEKWLADPEAARAAWTRVLDAARASGDLADLIQSMRARVVLERLEAAQGTGSAGSEDPP